VPIEFMMMDESAETPSPPAAPVDVALCIDREVYARLRPVLRHLCVGLIDWNVAVRVVTPSPDMPSLVFGPIQMTTIALAGRDPQTGGSPSDDRSRCLRRVL
jgi:hypothetical protein